jgi:glutathione S-transferase
MITLYHAPKSRSSRFIWLLEELGVPYEIKVVSIRRADGTVARADMRSIHPHGKVPALVHDGVTVFESAACALYLTDAFPEAKLGVPIGDVRRGPYLTWLAYYAGVMEPAFVGKALGFTTTNSTTGWAPTDDVLEYIMGTLSRAPYLVGDQFTSADVLFGSTFALFQGSPLLPKTDVISAYVDRLVARPAYQRALKKDDG